MTDIATLGKQIETDFSTLIEGMDIACGELTLAISAKNLRQAALKLRDDEVYHFEVLIDVCGVDYLHYGVAEWETDQATRYGFDRGVRQLGDSATRKTDIDGQSKNQNTQNANQTSTRFAVVYHLLSVKHNQRIRLRTFAEGMPPMVDSVHDIWASANWFEREAFDLYGILFNGHADLRRLLTDYGFIGHPFRKDFPLSGHVEVRYDKDQQRVIYEPVDIEPRVLVPKIIRNDSRYVSKAVSEEDTDAGHS